MENIFTEIVRNAIAELAPCDFTEKADEVYKRMTNPPDFVDDCDRENDSFEVLADALYEAFEAGFHAGAGFIDGVRKAL